MKMNPDVLGDLCRRIRTGHAVASDADFLAWVFRDQAGWIKPEQGLPDEGALVLFVPDGYTAWLIGSFDEIEGGRPRHFAFVIRDRSVCWYPGRVRAWRPAPWMPDWLIQEEASDAAD